MKTVPMKTALVLLAAASALILALPVHAADNLAATKSCIYMHDLRNHTVGGPRTLYFDVGGRSVYRVEMSNDCLATAVSSDPIVIRSQTGSPNVCNPLDLNIAVNQSRCLISNIVKLSPEEVAALPRKMKP